MLGPASVIECTILSTEHVKTTLDERDLAQVAALDHDGCRCGQRWSAA